MMPTTAREAGASFVVGSFLFGAAVSSPAEVVSIGVGASSAGAFSASIPGILSMAPTSPFLSLQSKVTSGSKFAGFHVGKE